MTVPTYDLVFDHVDELFGAIFLVTGKNAKFFLAMLNKEALPRCTTGTRIQLVREALICLCGVTRHAAVGAVETERAAADASRYAFNSPSGATGV